MENKFGIASVITPYRISVKGPVEPVVVRALQGEGSFQKIIYQNL